MKRIMIAVCIMLIGTAFTITDIYNYSFTKIEGGTQSISSLQGKRLLIITLPIQRNATADSMLYCLDTLATAHVNNLKVIAVPAIEDGYTAAQKNTLKNWYRSKLNNNIIISEGLYTRKTSGTQQHGLFQWLTKDALNNSFNTEVTGVGCKFFVSTTGELYSVLAPQSKISGANVQRSLQIQ